MNTPDTNIILQQNEMRLVTSPYGASLRGLSHNENPIVTGYVGAAGKVGGQGDVLIPFPGRVKGGHYAFAGQEYQMDRNDRDGPNAIHGFLRTKLWEITAHSENAVRYHGVLDPDEAVGYPFSLGAELTYELTPQGMACRFTVQNTGNNPAPVAAGFHPYFTVGSETIDGDMLRVPFASLLEFDNGLIPTGRILPVNGTPYDFLAPREIGTVALNTCYAAPRRDTDGIARITLSAGKRTVTVGMDRAFDYVVLYSGDPMPETHRRRALAIEPMTCASDAFNHPDWGLVSLAPGQSFGGEWTVSVSE